VTAPGAPFEITTVRLPQGHNVEVFVNSPGSLRDVFSLSRAREGQVFLVYEDERWTYPDVMRRVDALASVLVNTYGVAKGDRVAIGMRNYPEWVMAFAAITSIGAVSVSLNAWWTAEELDYALQDCGAKVLIADRERAERSRATCARLGTATIGVRFGETAGEDLEGVDSWESTVEAAVAVGASMPDVVVHPDDDATILYTSGTTGFPKGAVSTNRAVIHALQCFGCRSAVDAIRRPPTPDSAPAGPPSFILIVPLFHVTGSVPVMMSCFAAGLKLVVMYKWDPLRALQLIEREQITNFVGVPTQAFDLLECPEFAKYDTSSLISVGGGGAPAPPELVKRVDTSFKRARPNLGYGMTETNAYGPGNNGQDYVDRPTSTGRVVPTVRLAVRDPDGHDVPAGEVGEIWFYGAHLIRGYWGKPEATAETIVDGWLRSGDLGRIDDEGHVYVVDRAKDMVLRAGENVYCSEVEAAIYDHPAVQEAAVFGMPHERLGEEVAVAVHPKDGTTLSGEDLRAFLVGKIAPFKIPSLVFVVDQPLPRNPAGKFLKRQLREELSTSTS
jgi:long-chain acyl-CoA synthetase